MRVWGSLRGKRRVENDSLIIDLSHQFVLCGKIRKTGKELCSEKSKVLLRVGLRFLLDIQSELNVGGWVSTSGVQVRGGNWNYKFGGHFLIDGAKSHGLIRSLVE